MLSQKLFDEISSKISETIAASPAKDIEKNMRAMMAATFSKMDLVTREEFDIQQEVLARTREKLASLEERLVRAESLLFPDVAAEKAEAETTQGHS